MRPRQGVIRGNATLAGSCGGHCPLTAADCPDDGLRGWRDSGDPIDVETLPDGRFSVLERAVREVPDRRERLDASVFELGTT
jgi:hypothetical protein